MKKSTRARKSQLPGPHFSADELLGIRSATKGPEWNVEVRLIHHLGRPCRSCWTAVDELAPLVDGEALCRAPVVRALCRLGMPEHELCELTDAHRWALDQACDQPLAFCHLLLEEAWLEVRDSSQKVAEQLYAAFGPIAGNGVCLLAQREAHDLQARFYAHLAAAYCEAGDFPRARNATALGEAHQARGKPPLARFAVRGREGRNR